jgi:hypothetical protein
MDWFAWESWDWGTAIRTVIGAGIGSALVQGLLPFFREHHQRKKQAAYMAMIIFA